MQSSILHKIFDISPNYEHFDAPQAAGTTPMNSQEFPSAESELPKTKTFVGGKIRDNKMEYFQRWILYLFIFFLSVFFAIITMKDKQIVKSLLKKNKVNDMANDLGDEHLRWKKVTEFTVVFIALVLAYNFAFILGIFAWLAIGRLFTNREEPLKATWKKIFWKYRNQWDEEVFIGKNYFLTLLLVCFLTFVCYIGFSKWFKDWLDSMYFATNQNKKQVEQPQKYIHYYGLFLIIMFIFFLVLVDVKQLKDNKLYMFYNLAFFMAFMIVALSILKDFWNGKHKKLALAVMLVFLMFFLYPIFMELLMMEKNVRSIFNRKFFKNVIFEFSVPL